MQPRRNMPWPNGKPVRARRVKVGSFVVAMRTIIKGCGSAPAGGESAQLRIPPFTVCDWRSATTANHVPAPTGHSATRLASEGKTVARIMIRLGRAVSAEIGRRAQDVAAPLSCRPAGTWRWTMAGAGNSRSRRGGLTCKGAPRPVPCPASSPLGACRCRTCRTSTDLGGTRLGSEGWRRPAVRFWRSGRGRRVRPWGRRVVANRTPRGERTKEQAAE